MNILSFRFSARRPVAGELGLHQPKTGPARGDAQQQSHPLGESVGHLFVHLGRGSGIDVKEDGEPVERIHESVKVSGLVVGEDDDCDAHEVLLSGSWYTATPDVGEGVLDVLLALFHDFTPLVGVVPQEDEGANDGADGQGDGCYGGHDGAGRGDDGPEAAGPG